MGELAAGGVVRSRNMTVCTPSCMAASTSDLHTRGGETSRNAVHHLSDLFVSRRTTSMWNLPPRTRTRHLFGYESGCESFNDPLTEWNTAKVTTMKYVLSRPIPPPGPSCVRWARAVQCGASIGGHLPRRGTKLLSDRPLPLLSCWCCCGSHPTDGTHAHARTPRTPRTPCLVVQCLTRPKHSTSP